MSNNPAHTQEWNDLHALATKIQGTTLNDLFDKEPDRFEKFSLKAGDIFFDYSKQRVTKEIVGTLCDLAQNCGLDKDRQAMFDGEKINTTEGRAVLHTAMRRPKGDSVEVDGTNIMPEVHKTFAKMKQFSENLRSGKIKGATGKTITTVVSIGVGGSDLGPRMVCEALKSKDDPIDVLFVANIDGADLSRALQQCDAQTTLFIVISKSFGTQETLANALGARSWVQEQLGENAAIDKHFIGVSSNITAIKEFGIHPDKLFPMNEGVNGRFSLWSSIGLPICIQCGYGKFESLLQGAYEMDQHFLTAPAEENIPVLMAVLGIWNRNFLGAAQQAILPYATRLANFPAYLQQLEMESNGKTVDRDGQGITDYDTCPVIFGEIGTNSQHSFYQLLHQGSDIVPADFIGFKNAPYDNQIPLLNNMLAQSAALMKGRKNTTAPHKHFDGNRPSSTLILSSLTAHTLGQLIALYEHKTFVQGVIWNINSFDQFGVELGKELAKQMDNHDLNDADSSTKGLYSYIHKANE